MRTPSNNHLLLVLLVSAVAASSVALHAQSSTPSRPAAARSSGAATQGAATPGGGTTSVEMAPIECYWRTDAAAVHVGQPFTVVLTCGVLETASTIVVPDESRLDADVVQLQPFEVVGGTPATTVRTRTRRYFQYSYRLRYIGEEIGRDLTLPALTLTYRVHTRVQEGSAAIESRERQYILPPRPVRVLSLLPGTAQDIREQPPATFQAIDARRFTARVLRIVSFALFALATLVALWAVVRAFRSRRAHRHVTVRLASDAAILSGVLRELNAVRSHRQTEGWSDALAARALAALRVAANYEIAQPVTQTPDAAGASVSPGQLRVSGRWPRRTGVLLSGSATAAHVSIERARSEAAGHARSGRLADLERVLGRFAGAAYGREHATPDENALDESLADGIRAVGALRREHGWLITRLRALRHATPGLRSRAWAR